MTFSGALGESARGGEAAGRLHEACPRGGGGWALGVGPLGSGRCRRPPPAQLCLLPRLALCRVSDAKKKKAAAKKGPKGKAAAAAAPAAENGASENSSLNVESLASALALEEAKSNDRSCTGVLMSHPQVPGRQGAGRAGGLPGRATGCSAGCSAEHTFISVRSGCCRR